MVEALLVEPLRGGKQLSADLDAFDRELDGLVSHPRADLPTARRLASACRALLAACTTDPVRLHVAQVAIRYVVLDDDADGDCDSPYGFDDDVEVFNAVAAHLGLDELLLR